MAEVGTTGGPAAAAGEPKSGSIIAGRYRLDALLGRGGFGEVWRAHDLQTQRDVALKLLHAELAVKVAVRERFAREAEALGRLEHERIARLHRFDENNGAFIVMDYVRGRSLLDELVERAGSGAHFTKAEIVALMGQLEDAIGYAHRAGVWHRDLKPANLMVGADGTLTVLDFGVAKLAGDVRDATTVGRVIGSPLYLAPEQILGEPADARADIFALGTIAFELLTLRRAWARDWEDRPLLARPIPPELAALNGPVAITQRITSGLRPKVSAHRTDVDDALDRVLARAMAIEAGERHATAAELQRALSLALGVEDTRLRSEGTTSSANVATAARVAPEIATATHAAEVATATRAERKFDVATATHAAATANEMHTSPAAGASPPRSTIANNAATPDATLLAPRVARSDTLDSASSDARLSPRAARPYALARAWPALAALAAIGIVLTLGATLLRPLAGRLGSSSVPVAIEPPEVRAQPAPQAAVSAPNAANEARTPGSRTSAVPPDRGQDASLRPGLPSKAAQKIATPSKLRTRAPEAADPLRAELERLVRELESQSNDFESAKRLSEAIARGAELLPRAEDRTSIKRCATSGMFPADVRALKACADSLLARRASPAR